MTIALATPPPVRSPLKKLRFLSLEITDNCQLACVHCYAKSGPARTHGQMTLDDWLRVIDEAAELGVEMIQFIGGEATQHPGLVPMVRHALSHGMSVEVFTNLLDVSDDHWEMFGWPRVQVATSYYSDDAAEHARVTKMADSHSRTTANIAEVVRRGIPLAVSIIEVLEGQRIHEAAALLAELGVKHIRFDQMRQVGRGVRDVQPGPNQLCGHCTDGRLTVTASGQVQPCLISRWLKVGDARTHSLREVYDSAVLAGTLTELDEAFRRGEVRPAAPNPITACGPNNGGEPPPPPCACGPLV